MVGRDRFIDLPRGAHHAPGMRFGLIALNKIFALLFKLQHKFLQMLFCFKLFCGRSDQLVDDLDLVFFTQRKARID